MAGSVKTSFQKKSRGKIIQIPGTKPSLHNNQLLVSTGIPSLDSLLGGGLGVGTVLLIGEDSYGSYSKMMLKYFIAEGIIDSHNLLLSSADLDLKQLLKELPRPIIDDPGVSSVNTTDKENESSNSEAMKIAWRYQNLPKVQSSAQPSQFGHYFDLTKTMDTVILEKCSYKLVNIQKEIGSGSIPKNSLMLPSYQILLQKISAYIQENDFGTAKQIEHKNILRLALHSLGSPQWGEDGDGSSSLCRFLYALRMMMRTSYSACVITMPTNLFYDASFIENIQHMCDAVINLESFVNTDKENNPALKDYHGLLHVKKLPRLNSLTCHTLETLDLAFKLRRKKFLIEKLHLPPDLSETASRDQEESLISTPKPGCVSTGGSSKLDF